MPREWSCTKRRGYRAAAVLARRHLPGLSESWFTDELTAYAEFGYRFSEDGLIHSSRRPSTMTSTTGPNHSDLRTTV